jgi:hypothetical protein
MVAPHCWPWLAHDLSPPGRRQPALPPQPLIGRRIGEGAASAQDSSRALQGNELKGDVKFVYAHEGLECVIRIGTEGLPAHPQEIATRVS